MGDTFEGELLPLEQIPPEECYPEDLEDETGQKFIYVPVPTGRWRDDFCACCINPLVCCFSCFCGPGTYCLPMKASWIGFLSH